MKSILTMLLVALGLSAVVVSADAETPLGTWYRNAPTGTTDGAGAVPDALKAGYNYFHATNCAVFIEGTAGAVCVLSTTAENIVACTANQATQTGMLTACQTGNIVAIYIPNLATGVFTQFITFLVK